MRGGGGKSMFWVVEGNGKEREKERGLDGLEGLEMG